MFKKTAYLLISACCVFVYFFQFQSNLIGEPLRIGVLSAVPMETKNLPERFEHNYSCEISGRRIYHHGILCGLETILTNTRVGKVAAATATTHLIQKYQPDYIIYIGVGASVSPELKVGDIVIGEKFIQHDLDCTPFSPRFQIPILKITEIKADPMLVDFSENAALKLLANKKIGNFQPSIKRGLIISGDQVFSSKAQIEILKNLLPEAICVEMEGAAVAQVCYEYGVPFVVIRVISDDGTENSHEDCFEFLKTHMPEYSSDIIQYIFDDLKKQEQDQDE